MRALIQRVTSAAVHVDGQQIGAIDGGLLVFVCAMPQDDETVAKSLATKISKLRVFRDDQERMNKSVLDVAGQVLVVSQFTLAADTSRGNRPGFSAAAAPEIGEALYKKIAASMAEMGIDTQTGKFGADMVVSLVNDGPVTIWMDTEA